MKISPVARLLMAAVRLGLERQVREFADRDDPEEDQFVLINLNTADLPYLESLTSGQSAEKAERFLPGQLELF